MFHRRRIVSKNRFFYGPPAASSRPRRGEGLKRRFSLLRLAATRLRIPDFASFRLPAVILGVFLLCGAMLYLLAFSGVFAIDEIKVRSEDDLTSIHETLKTSLRPLYGKNLLFFRPADVEKKLLDDHRELASIRIKKDFPNRVNVTYREVPIVANVLNLIARKDGKKQQKKFLINAKGFAVKTDVENPNLLYIRMATETPLELGGALIPAERLDYIRAATALFEEEFDMKLIDVDYLSRERELHLHTERRFIVLLDMETEFQIQLDALKRATEKLDIYKVPLSSIDLRVATDSSSRVIYKKK